MTSLIFLDLVDMILQCKYVIFLLVDQTVFLKLQGNAGGQRTSGKLPLAKNLLRLQVEG
jgi:hypothetical protein